jgi:glycosyltransferase involved in cell wall biosynthesis
VSQNIGSATTVAKAPARSISKIEAIGIVIATRNHATDIATCIAGLFAANSRSGWHHSLWIVVVADASSDDTAKIARQALGAFGQVLEISAQSRQVAHRVGAAAVIDHFRDVPRHSLLLASRDATANVACDWIDQQIKASRTPFGLTSAY